MTDNPYRELLCPMPECGEPLYVEQTGSYGITAGDLAVPEDLPADAAHSSRWQVVCTDGHVILLPGDPDCPCDDPGGDNCPEAHVAAYDWSDDTRTFRVHDWARLETVLARLSGVPA